MNDRIQFDTPIAFRAESDLPPAIAEAARRERTSQSEFLRRAVRDAVTRAGVTLDAPALAEAGR